MRRFALLLLVLGAWAWPRAARASGDIACVPRQTLAERDVGGCDSRAILHPANDTRVNLLLLMRAARAAAAPVPVGAPPPPLFDWAAYRTWLVKPVDPSESYVDGEGSRCRSNTDGRAAFGAAVRAARGLDAADRAALIAAREALAPDCEKAAALGLPTTAAAARPWAEYLTAAAAFYAGDFAAAARGFGGLAGADEPWLAETARYMVARVELNLAQAQAFDEWGEPDFAKVDRGALARAASGFEAYLKNYPAGRYAASVRGLQRRVWWLARDAGRLAATYGALMREDPATRGISDVDLAQEIDNKLRPLGTEGVTEPLLLAVADLAALRDGTLTGEPLAAQRHAFAREPALYAFLRAAQAFYAAKRPAEVVQLIPAAAGDGALGSIALSGQVLRAQALDATRDPAARAIWLGLLPRAPGRLERAPAELGLALHDERAGALDALLAPGSPLTVPLFRETLLFTVADAAMLRRAAQAAGPRHEREVALFILLYKELSRGFYAAFARDLALVPAGASTGPIEWDGLLATERPPIGLFTQTRGLGDLGCPPLRVTAATLATNPRQPRALLCVADFFQANGFDGGAYDAQPVAAELGGTRSLFPGRPYERAAVYRAVLDDRAASVDDKAYALYRQIRCYAPGGSNSCGGADVPRATRRAWFLRLKQTYPQARWAQRADVWW